MKIKNNALGDIPENETIPFDLYHITSAQKKKVSGEDFNVEMNRYFGKGMIMDFYKNNSNIFRNE